MRWDKIWKPGGGGEIKFANFIFYYFSPWLIGLDSIYGGLWYMILPLQIWSPEILFAGDKTIGSPAGCVTSGIGSFVFQNYLLFSSWSCLLPTNTSHPFLSSPHKSPDLDRRHQGYSNAERTLWWQLTRRKRRNNPLLSISSPQTRMTENATRFEDIILDVHVL